MPKIFEGSKVFVLMYYSDEEPVICDIFTSREKAVAEKRRRNEQYCGGTCFTSDWDFNYDEYDSCDYNFYDVCEYELIF